MRADIDRDRRVGGSRPNQNDYVAISAANHQSGGEDGCYGEKFRNSIAWVEPDPKTAFFRVFRVPSTTLRIAYRKQFYPKSMVPMESRDSEGVPFASLESL